MKTEAINLINLDERECAQLIKALEKNPVGDSIEELDARLKGSSILVRISGVSCSVILELCFTDYPGGKDIHVGNMFGRGALRNIDEIIWIVKQIGRAAGARWMSAESHRRWDRYFDPIAEQRIVTWRISL